MRIILALLSCLLAFTAVQAQIYRFKVYSSSTGLRSNAIYTIFQDSKGFIWFGTDGGVCRYDGVTYTNFGLQQGLIDTSVYSILEDDKGLIWFGTKNGISSYNGERFTNFTTKEGLLANETHTMLRRRDGSLWFGTRKSLSRFENGKFISFGAEAGLPDGPIWSLLEDRAGNFWVGTRGGGLAKFDGAKFTKYGKNEGLKDNNIFGIAEDRNKGLCLATDGGLCYFDGQTFQHYNTSNGLSSDLASTVLVDRENRVWCATFGGGISRFEQGKFTNFNRSNGLPDNYVMSLYEDYEGNIWCGSRWSGACRFTNEMFANYTTANGIGDGLITGLAESSDGSLWVSSINDGLSVMMPDNSVKRYGVKTGLLEDGLWTVFIDSQKRAWVGGQRGVSYLKDNQIKSFTLEEIGAKARITGIIEDRQGRLWFGSNSSTSNAVVIYDGKNFQSFSTNNGLISGIVYSFYRDRSGNIWICTESGLSRFDGEKFTNYTVADGLPDKHVLCVYQDEQNQLWVGTGEGISRFDGQRFQTFTIKDGLASNVIRTINEVGDTLWVGTSNGISMLSGTRFQSFTVRDGMISDEISLAACIRRDDQSLWFGTNEGLVRYRAARQMTRDLPPRVYLRTLRATDREVNERELKDSANVSLAYNQNSITFEFLGLSFIDEAGIKYSYLLENFDRDWSSPTETRSVRFTNLPPGDYNFLVKACSATGLWSEPIRMSLQIRPPFWQTWLFRLIVLAVLIALIYAIYTWRIHVIEQRQEQRLASLRQLLESIRIINSQLDLTTVLQNIAAESARLVDGEPGGIGLMEDNQLVFHRLWLKDHWEDARVSFQLGEGVAGRVAQTAQAMIVNEPHNDTTVCYPELLEKYYVHGFMNIPIIDRRGKVVGVLDLRRRVGRVPFTDSDRQLIESLAHQAAIAIENADLYGELAKQNLMIVESLKEIEKLYENEQEVTRTLQELNRMKTNFMMVTSHEMRTPLTVLKGYHEALLDEYFGKLSDSQRRSLSTCQRTVDRLVASFNDILEMLKISEGRIQLKPVLIDINGVVEETIGELTTFIERRGQRVELITQDELPSVTADRDKVRLVLLNLIQNAIKFTPDNGEIRVSLYKESDMIHIAVVDTGIGIEDSELEIIFDEFYTSSDASHHSSGKYQFEARGTGLGLAIARSFVQAHGGQIWAESGGKGHGSTFHVLLPVTAKIQTVAVAGPASAHSR